MVKTSLACDSEGLQIAAKELGMVCFPKRNLLTAMIPLHRRDVHLKKYVSEPEV